MLKKTVLMARFSKFTYAYLIRKAGSPRPSPGPPPGTPCGACGPLTLFIFKPLTSQGNDEGMYGLHLSKNKTKKVDLVSYSQNEGTAAIISRLETNQRPLPLPPKDQGTLHSGPVSIASHGEFQHAQLGRGRHPSRPSSCRWLHPSRPPRPAVS